MSMVFGASAAGGRAMTSSSSPGVSLKQEGISYACGADIPCVVVNVARSGPGLGGISPSQGDYFQATRGGGHGDYYHIVLAPKSVQEAADLTYEAFDLADKWRMPVMVLADGLIGQMMEGVVLPPARDASPRPDRPWAVGHQAESAPSAQPRHLALILDPAGPRGLGPRALRALRARSRTRRRSFEAVNIDKAELVFVAYGTASRVCLGALQMAKERGPRAGPVQAHQPLALPLGRARAARRGRASASSPSR